jgi:hypothetical protein
MATGCPVESRRIGARSLVFAEPELLEESHRELEGVCGAPRRYLWVFDVLISPLWPSNGTIALKLA